MQPKTLTVLSLLSLVTLSLPSASMAAEKTFTVGKPGLDARQVATIESDTSFENFTGRTAAIKGTINFDPAKKTSTGATLTVDLSTVDTGIALRNDHMKSEGWLNTAKYPNAVFKATSVRHKGGDNYTVSGFLTLHGVSKPLSTTVTLKYVPESAVTKRNGFEGDVVQVKGKVKILLSDFGVKVPDMAKDKVSNEVTLAVTAVGVSK